MNKSKGKIRVGFKDWLKEYWFVTLIVCVIVSMGLVLPGLLYPTTTPPSDEHDIISTCCDLCPQLKSSYINESKLKYDIEIYSQCCRKCVCELRPCEDTK